MSCLQWNEGDSSSYDYDAMLHHHACLMHTWARHTSDY